MDKLQPILKHHFWILLVPLFSMNLWGYFSTNRALKDATEARQKELDSVKSGIPSGINDPNSKYAEELKKRNDVLEKHVDEELLALWNRQKERMVWPPRVAPDIPKVYKSVIKSSPVRMTYQKDFSITKQRVFEVVEPYVLDRKGITWTPKVDFPIEFIIPDWTPSNLPIESKTMWDTQEDLWFTQLILEAIRQLNKDADSESSAMVRKVTDFRLLGGDGESTVMPGEEGGDDSGGGGGGKYDDEDEGSGLGGRMPLAAGASIVTSVAFDPAEEFGKGGDPALFGALLGGGMLPSSSGDDEEAEESEEVPTGPLRYIKEDEAAPYVERGFYLSVIINQNKIVDFLVALSNSEWPVRVVRYHFGKNPFGGPDEFSARGRGNLALGGIGADDDDREGRQRGGGVRRIQRPMASRPTAQNDEGGLNNFLASGGIAAQAAGVGARRGPGAPTNTGYPPEALLQPDLVQLDLAGVITFYRQPKSEIPAEDVGTEDGEKPAESSGDPAEGEVAAEGETPADGEAAVDGTAAPASAAEPNAEGDSEMSKDAEVSNEPAAESTETEAMEADEFSSGAPPAKAAEGEVPEAVPEAPSTPVGEATPATTDGEEATAPAPDEAAAEDEFSSPPTVNKAPEGGEKPPVESEAPPKPE